MSILKYIPFSYHWIVRQAIGDDVKTVLDMGCGGGEFMRDISEGKKWDIVGVDLHESSLKKAKKTGLYSKLIRADVTKLPKSITNSKYDVVFSSQVIEHLKKGDGKPAITRWSALAKKRLILSTPVGFIEFGPIEEEVRRESGKNPLQKHLSGWTPEEFEALGFIVWGQGARFIYGPGGIARRFPTLMHFFAFFSMLFSPIAYFFPKTASNMIAIKEMK